MLLSLMKKKCFVCNKNQEYKDGLCKECLTLVNVYSKSKKCAKCNRKINEFADEALCENCKALKPHFDMAIALYKYDGEFKNALRYFKFKSGYSSVLDICKLMKMQVDKMNVEFDIIVPVPSTYISYISRNYCAAAELSYKLSSMYHKKSYDNILKKYKRPPQEMLEFKDRYKNVEDAFYMRKESQELIKDKRILLVDDVITSGATVSCCARVLKENGAKNVYACAFLYGG